MKVIFFLADWISLIAYSVLIFLVLKEFVPLRFQNRFFHILEIACLLVGGNAIVYPEEVTGTVGSLFVILPILILFHKSEWYMKITTALIVYPAMMSLAFLFQDIGQQIWQYAFHGNMTPDGQTALYLFTRFLKVPVWYLIYRCVKVWVPQAVRMLTERMWLVLSLISLAYDDSYLAWPACIATLITSMGCCYLCTYMARIVRSDMELETMRYQKSYYQEVESSQETVRRMRHDMKNHLGVVEMLVRGGEYEKAEQYLHGLDQEFASRTRIYCADPVVNAVLNAKMEKAEGSGISCEYQVDLEEALPLDDIELCSLFANTLDNAVEACEKIREREKRRISLKARCRNGHFSYEIVNSKENRVTEKNGNFETDKSDRLSHGIGLRSVRQIVRKYEGEMDVSYTEDTFSVTIFV